MTIHTDSASLDGSLGLSGPAINQQLLAGRRAFLGYLRRRLGSLEEAEDVLQDFSIKVIRSADSARQNEKINVWMRQILRHALIDHYRRRATRQRAEASFAREMTIVEATDGEPAEAWPCRCLHTALPRLRPDYAELLRRVDLEEVPRARIAAETGLTMNALNVRLFRARQALRQELEATCTSCRDGRFMDCPDK